MATFSLAALLGLKPAAKSTKQPHTLAAAKNHKKDNKTMFDFNHLKPGASARPRADEQYQDQSTQQRLDGDNASNTVYRPSQHIRAHNVAVSDEAKANPVLAIRLLKDTDLSSKKIKAQLANAPEALSKFTQSHMEENDPGWEFQDEEEQAFTASSYSLNNSDKNGYRAARDRATKSLAKMVEPMTEDETQAMIARTTQMLNASDPDTPDNVDARRQADEEYKEAVAQAAAQRNAKFRATGVALPGDSRRVSGKVVTKMNESETIKAQLDAGMPAPGTVAR